MIYMLSGASQKVIEQLHERFRERLRTMRIPADDPAIPSERAFRALREGLEMDRVVFDALVALRTR
jgi:hypothetical protein